MAKKHTIGLSITAVVILGIGSMLLFLTFKSQPSIKTGPQAEKEKTTAYLANVNESPAKNYQWAGNPHEPKYITMPSIGAEGFIQKVGIAKNKEIGVPSNIHLAGWFSDSVAPGKPGLSIIDGHVDGRKTPGIFSHLKDLRPGDDLTIRLGNDKVVAYTVIEVREVNLADALTVLFSQSPSVVSQLNLITCGGSFNVQTNSYEKRIIVSTRQISIQ